MGYDKDFINDKTKNETEFTVELPVLWDITRESAYKNGQVINHTRFSLVFNEKRNFATYTAHNIDGSDMIEDHILKDNNIKRDADYFKPDPNVPEEIQINDERGYKGDSNPWDRGHLVRRKALLWGTKNVDEAKKANKESFYWTNIAPQHKHLHHGPWGEIENWMLSFATYNRACVFTGPVFTPADPEVFNDGHEKFKVPAGYWKIIALKHDNKLKTGAFIVWHRDYEESRTKEHNPTLERVRVTTIEYLSGMRFESLREPDHLPAEIPTFTGLIKRGFNKIAGISDQKFGVSITNKSDIKL